jgi:hypothetical protein
MAWLPRPTELPADPAGLPPWRPRRFRRLDLSGHRYAMIDELDRSTALVALWPWPGVKEGRLVFGDEEAVVGVDADALRDFLSRNRLPPALSGRELRTGDVFAIRVKPGADLDDPEVTRDPSRWIEPPVYDVTADARRAAKVAFYSAVSEPLRPDEAIRIMRTPRKQDSGRA